MSTAVAEREPAPEKSKTGTAVARKSEADSVRQALEKMRPQFQMALPKHLTPDRLLRVAMTAIQNTPKLLECDRTSLYSAIMTCAQLGLEPDGVLGQAYLVPFAGRVQFIPGYKGLITLARNSGDVVSIAAHEVRERDHFIYAFGLNEKLEHVPARSERGEITYFYAIARFKDGGHHWDVMTRAEVEIVRNRSAGWQSAVKFNKQDKSPWSTDFAEMGKKTVIRRIAKYLPMSVQKASALADSFDAGRHATLDVHGDVVIDTTAETVPDRQIAQGGSKLDEFERTHSAEQVDQETGEVTGDGAPTQEVAQPQPEAPPSPLKLKGKAREDGWAPWEAWGLAEISRLPRADVAGFMERHKAELDFIAENRTGSWQKFEEAIDAKREGAQ
jgi:recombination protein RecT